MQRENYKLITTVVSLTAVHMLGCREIFFYRQVKKTTKAWK